MPNVICTFLYCNIDFFQSCFQSLKCLNIFKTLCSKIQSKEGRGQGWRKETRVTLFNKSKSQNKGRIIGAVHKSSAFHNYAVSRTSPVLRAVSVHKSQSRLSLSDFHYCQRLFYLVSSRQLLQSDTGVHHFALDILTHRSSPDALSLAADFAEPRPRRHTLIYVI